MNIMRKTKNNSVKIDWNSISIAKYEEIVDIINAKNDDITTTVELLKTVFGDKDYWNLPMNELTTYSRQLAFINEPPKFEVPTKLKKVIIAGREFNVMADLDKITVAQFTDFQGLAHLKNTGLEDALSIFLVPADKKSYNTDYDILEVREYIKNNCSLVQSQSILGFVLVKSIKYFQHFLASSLKTNGLTMEQKEMIVNKLETIVTNLEGGISAGCV